MSLTKRGGYHAHAERWGRKSAWNHPTPTRTIRVPEGLADKILNYAHTVDNGEDYERQVILTALDRYIESQLARSGGNQHKKKGEIQDIENKRDWTHLVKFRKEIEGE